MDGYGTQENMNLGKEIFIMSEFEALNYLANNKDLILALELIHHWQLNITQFMANQKVENCHHLMLLIIYQNIVTFIKHLAMIISVQKTLY